MVVAVHYCTMQSHEKQNSTLLYRENSSIAVNVENHSHHVWLPRKGKGYDGWARLSHSFTYRIEEGRPYLRRTCVSLIKDPCSRDWRSYPVPSSNVENNLASRGVMKKGVSTHLHLACTKPQSLQRDDRVMQSKRQGDWSEKVLDLLPFGR